MGNSFGCSASGERLVSAARDGDLQEAQALLDYNPRLAKYSTFGVRNSPLHFSAMQGHNEVGGFFCYSQELITLCVFLGLNFNAYGLQQREASLLSTALSYTCQKSESLISELCTLARSG